MSQIKDLEDVIIAGSQSKIFTRVGSGKNDESSLDDLRGIIKEEYTSEELEDKANEWRSKLSD